MSIPTQIQITLRSIKNAALTWNEADENFKNLRDAILRIAEGLQAGRVIIGSEPAPGERNGVLWIPTDPANGVGIFRWDGSKWIRVTDPALYAVTQGTASALTATLAWNPASYTELIGRVITIKSHIDGAAGGCTININGLGAKPVKRMYSIDRINTGDGDIVLDGVYALVYDGNEFILLNPTPQPPVTGGPVFLDTPVDAHPGGALVAWKDYDASANVPAGAKAVILQVVGHWGGTGNGYVQVRVKKSVAGSPLVAVQCGQTSGTELMDASQQGIYPIDENRHFMFEVTASSGVLSTANIHLIGYVI